MAVMMTIHSTMVRQRHSMVETLMCNDDACGVDPFDFV